MDLSNEALNGRIDALRSRFDGYAAMVNERNRAYLRAFAPTFNSDLQEHDQWPDPLTSEEANHTRSSYNVTRAAVELWASLEGWPFPAIRWNERYIPSPVPSLDPEENAARQTTYRAQKLVARHIATLREQTLGRHMRRSRLQRHWFRATVRKNLYGHAWLKGSVDLRRRTFTFHSKIDPSTVYPVWSAWDDTKLDAVLVAYRRSAQVLHAQFPDAVPLSKDGLTVSLDGYYRPTAERQTEADLNYVWVEDYWLLDATYATPVADDAKPITGVVVNALRINGKIVQRVEYPGWQAIPYFLLQNENHRDNLGFSDAAAMLPFQDALNRMLSQQQDVIFGESRPKFKYRGDANRVIRLDEEGVVSLDPDEDIEQLAVRMDVFPTQIHGQQITQVMQRAEGLPAVVWGEIQQAQNSGRALATSWRAVGARMVPRIVTNGDTIDQLVSWMCDTLELYGWDDARDLFNGERDFEPDFPNQEPRDFLEVTTDALNRLNGGLTDQAGAMELIGERSPDDRIEAVRADYMDPVLHPEKAQSFLLLQRLKNQIGLELQQAAQQQAMVDAQMAQLAATPAGAAPSGASVDGQAAAAAQARTQATQQAAPRLAEGQNGPATQAGAPANGAQRYASTLVQDGESFNRIVDKQPL